MGGRQGAAGVAAHRPLSSASWGHGIGKEGSMNMTGEGEGCVPADVVLALTRLRLRRAAYEALLGLHYDDHEFDRLVLAYRDARFQVQRELCLPHSPRVAVAPCA
jgi:hypothetical protein